MNVKGLRGHHGLGHGGGHALQGGRVTLLHDVKHGIARGLRMFSRVTMKVKHNGRINVRDPRRQARGITKIMTGWGVSRVKTQKPERKIST